jgi:hypothetical protein
MEEPVLPLLCQVKSPQRLADYATAQEIVFLLGTYPDMVWTVLRMHELSGVVVFAFRLAHGISSAWETVHHRHDT